MSHRMLRQDEILDSLHHALERLTEGRTPRTLRAWISHPTDATPLFSDLCAEQGQRCLGLDGAA